MRGCVNNDNLSQTGKDLKRLMKHTNKIDHQPASSAMDSQARCPPRLVEDIIYLLAKIGVIVLVVFALFTFVFGLIPVTDDDMDPAFHPGDLTMVYRLDKRYKQFDAIAVYVDGEPQIRRVVAVPGDTVDMSPDGLMINGSLQQEPSNDARTLPYEEGIAFPITLAEDEIFVLGDARQGAEDSRVYGAVKKSDTLGKVMALLRRRGF